MCDGDEHEHEKDSEEKGPITVLALAIFRGAKPGDDDCFTMGAIEATGLPFMGGCQECGATIAAYNACPSKTGFLRCRSECIGNLGFATVEEANIALFPGEYEWQGVKTTPAPAEQEWDED